MRKKVFLLLLLGSLIPIFSQKARYCFSPKGNCGAWLLYHLQRAQKSLDIAIYSFTHRKIAHLLVKLHNKGVKIRVITDKASFTGRNHHARFLSRKGIPVYIWMKHGKMHNKYVIIDRKILITGSFNWSRSAEKRNAENLVLLEDPSFLRAFQANFERLLKESCPLPRILIIGKKKICSPL